MSDLFLRLESVAVGTDFSRVHLYRIDNAPDQIWDGTVISSVLVSNALADSLYWCSFSLRSVLSLLLGERLKELERLNQLYNNHANDEL